MCAKGIDIVLITQRVNRVIYDCIIEDYKAQDAVNQAFEWARTKRHLAVLYEHEYTSSLLIRGISHWLASF